MNVPSWNFVHTRLRGMEISQKAAENKDGLFTVRL